MKIILILLFLANSSKVLIAQEKYIEKEVVYFRNGLTLKPTHFYLVNGDSAFLLKYENGYIFFPDSISRKYVDLLFVFNGEKIGIPMFEYRESKFLHIYYDCRLFRNRVAKKFDEYSKRKYLLKKRYLIDSGLHYYIIISKKVKKQFKLDQ